MVESPTPSLLLYLFADRVLGRGRMPFGRVALPCRDTKVRGRQLADNLLATAYWSLMEQGLVRLELAFGDEYQEDGSTRLVLLDKPLLEGTGRPGLEGKILEHAVGSVKASLPESGDAMNRGEPEGGFGEKVEITQSYLSGLDPESFYVVAPFSIEVLDVHEVLNGRKRYGRKAMRVVELIRREAVERGYVRQDDDGAESPDCHEILRLEGRFDDQLGRLHGFQRAEPALWRALLED